MKKLLFWSVIAIMLALIFILYIRAIVIRHKVKTSAQNNNVQAFLMMIRNCEGTSGADGYRTVFGGGTIGNLADHPALTGEWTGKRLPDSMCRGAGLNPPCYSTAAGAYQILKPTWTALKKKLALPDFSPQSQDYAAIELVRQRGALDDVVAGRLSTAIEKCRKEWASLPGAGYNQGEKTLAEATNYYTAAGGNLA